MTTGRTPKPRGWLAYLVSIFIACFAATASAQLVEHDLKTLSGFTGDERTIQWIVGEPDENHGESDYFEAEILMVENGTVEEFQVTEPILNWTPQQIGHYKVRVRACNDAGCSEYGTSDDSGWWLFFWLKSPEF